MYCNFNWMVDDLTFLWATTVKVYIIGGDGTQKGANAIYEVFIHDGVVRCRVQDIISNTRVV